MYVSCAPPCHGFKGANLGDASQWNLVCKEFISCSAQFVDFLIVENMNPAFGVVGVIFSLPDGFSLDLLGKFGVRTDQVIERRVLAAGLDAIRKDLSVHRLLGRACQRVGCCRLGVKYGGCHDENVGNMREGYEIDSKRELSSRLRERKGNRMENGRLDLRRQIEALLASYVITRQVLPVPVPVSSCCRYLGRVPAVVHCTVVDRDDVIEAQWKLVPTPRESGTDRMRVRGIQPHAGGYYLGTPVPSLEYLLRLGT